MNTSLKPSQKETAVVPFFRNIYRKCNIKCAMAKLQQLVKRLTKILFDKGCDIKYLSNSDCFYIGYLLFQCT